MEISFAKEHQRWAAAAGSLLSHVSPLSNYGSSAVFSFLTTEVYSFRFLPWGHAEVWLHVNKNLILFTCLSSVRNIKYRKEGGGGNHFHTASWNQKENPVVTILKQDTSHSEQKV